MLMKKQRYLADQIKYLTHFDVEERLFLFLEEQFGKNDEIVTDLSKKDIASAIRTTPETLSRLLIRLEKEDRMNWTGRKIKIKWNAVK